MQHYISLDSNFFFFVLFGSVAVICQFSCIHLDVPVFADDNASP